MSVDSGKIEDDILQLEILIFGMDMVGNYKCNQKSRILYWRADIMSKWSEIRCDFFDENDRRYCVDGWQTSNDCEEGKTIAKINLKNKSVEYLDQDAKTDEYTQEVINEFLKTDMC